MRVFLSSPHMGERELEYVRLAFDANWIAPMGPFVDKFERLVAGYVGAQYGVALSSGTAAIHMALKYLDVGPGDTVFCSSLTFAASCNPIVYQGATPVFIDSESESWNMCPAALKRALEKYPNPKAIIVVNLYGQSADYDAIRAVSGDIPIIEDAAESLGATYRGRQTGSLGDFGVFSFNGNKIITTSGGGMLVTNEKGVADKVKFWATQAREPFPWYEHKEIGYNYRLSNVCAGIGCGQMEILNERIARKHEIREYYFRHLSDILDFMPTASFGNPICWLTTGLLRNGQHVPADMVAALEKNNIESRPVWKPMHIQPVFKAAPYFTAKDGVDVSAELFARGICLPSDTKMTKEQLERIIRICRSL